MSLPYENATSGDKALGEMEKLLRKFGCSKFGSGMDYDKGTLSVQFEYRNRMVNVTASAKGYAAAWLKEHPYKTQYHRHSKAEHERRALHQGNIAIYSILRDWVKGQVMAIETGILSFEGAFLGQIMLPNGSTVLEHIERQDLLPQLPGLSQP